MMTTLTESADARAVDTTIRTQTHLNHNQQWPKDETKTLKPS